LQNFRHRAYVACVGLLKASHLCSADGKIEFCEKFRLTFMFHQYIWDKIVIKMKTIDNRLKLVERRSGIDRRKGKYPVFSKYWFTGRRSTPRRIEDRQKSYRIDLYNSKVFGITLLIMLLSALDAFFTLYLISNGATELNPVMAYFLSFGHVEFFLFKYFLTFASVMMVLINKDIYLSKTRIRAKIFLFLFLIPFALVVKWELFLIFYVL